MAQQYKVGRLEDYRWGPNWSEDEKRAAVRVVKYAHEIARRFDPEDVREAMEEED